MTDPTTSALTARIAELERENARITEATFPHFAQILHKWEERVRQLDRENGELRELLGRCSLFVPDTVLGRSVTTRIRELLADTSEER